MAYFKEENMVSAKDFAVKKCKATIQKSGKLGFSSAAAELMQLQPSRSLLVSDCQDGNLAMVVLPDASDMRAFPVRKSAAYYTVDLKMFFDQRGVDYHQDEYTIIYDIVLLPEKYLDRPVYKLTKRLKKRRTKVALGTDGEEETNETN